MGYAAYFTPDIGAMLLPGGSGIFRVWAPLAERVELLFPDSDLPSVPLSSEQDGYFSVVVDGLEAGSCYWYLLDGLLRRPDPASRCQPHGVHGPSALVDPCSHQWQDSSWQGCAQHELIIYELHIGTFTPAGTFDDAISRLDYLCELGITAVELMPVAQFPGKRNWGYDGTFIFAPQNSYGGVDGLKRLVDACHARGLAVILDVVYNHLGPEGNYLHAFGPYFTSRYRTPWGDAVNFDGPDSDQVRHYFIENALYWITEYHIDGLRLDAVHGIYDFGARHILQELTEAVHGRGSVLGRRVQVIAESDQNDTRLVTTAQYGGYGLDAQWNDDFHHALRTCLTNDRAGYYKDFGDFSSLVKSFSEGFVLSGQYSTFRRRCHGSSSAHIHPGRMVVFSQNHDQIGNRMRGERLGEHLSTEQLMLAAAAVILSPYMPLLFMGEEYGETAPFPYFVSHSDEHLVEAVRRGRREEFAAFADQGTPPDPQDETTFLSGKLNTELRFQGEHQRIFDFYCRLISLRKEYGEFFRLGREALEVSAIDDERLLTIVRSTDSGRLISFYNFSGQRRTICLPTDEGALRLLLNSDTADTEKRVPTLAPFGVLVIHGCKE